MQLHVFDDKEKLAEGLAEWISDLIHTTLFKQEFFTLVLSGGETPKILFQKLIATYKEKINWKRVHIFWGDERAVPFNDDRNNAKMAFDLLISHLDIPASQVHVMRTDIEPLFSAMEYSKMLHTFFQNTSSTFDLVLLGMGDDGHTLSLFPGEGIVPGNKDWVHAIFNEAQQMFRITLMPEIVNRASAVVFMVEGAKKSSVLKQVIEGKYEQNELPAQIIQPINGNLHWFLDKAAANDLKKGD
jgi:6-phosphogluconolactonase